MRKAIIALVAAVLALAGGPVLAAARQVPRADATPGVACGWVGNRYCCQNMYGYRNCSAPVQQPARPAQPARPPAQPAPHPVQPAPHPAPTVPVQAPPPVKPPPPPTAVPVVTPKINPPGPGAPTNAAKVTPPKGIGAPQQAVTAAKSAPATRVNPVAPPKPPTQTNFSNQVQNVTSAHGGNVDVVNADNQALTRPRHWDYVDYDQYHRPTLYNPLKETMTFRYFYNDAYREVAVPGGGHVALDVAAAGLYPFTAVSDSYLTSGSFYGGAFVPPDGFDGPAPADYTPPPAPTVYQDVTADVPAANQTVQVGQVTVVGHDDSKPAGSQDTFMLDDNTLAWGQVNPPGHGAQITVTKTQSLPGVGPTDNGSFLVALAAHEQSTDNTWWLWPLGGGVLVVIAGLVAWVVIRRRERGGEHSLVSAGGAPDEADPAESAGDDDWSG